MNLSTMQPSSSLEFTALDIHPLKEALNLAEQAIGLTDPNPRVGCVITTADGRQTLGRGHTQPAGQAHAEVMALNDARQRGHAVHGATAYVTLEPCSHHGRTPPCCDALIAAGIGRVVIATGDPNPLVNGQGAQRLRAAGLIVHWAPASYAKASEALNVGFFHRMRTGRPWVRLKMAMSIDGRTALPNGKSQWITGEAARADGHAWRKRAGMVLTGIGTVLADNPRLDVRAVSTPHQPQRAVVDARLQTPSDALILGGESPVVIYAAGPAPAQAARLQNAGAQIVDLPGADHRVDLTAVIADLGHKAINELHVEAGPRLSGSMLQADLVDELLIYQAPILLGPGRPVADLPTLEDIQQGRRYEIHDLAQLGTDLRLRLRRSTSGTA
jgi:diaminohydroxyphosphoribosylaminopyrimidine deaminase / 5-amino-6-(5-phosphoribosylamino)uracil reductase